MAATADVYAYSNTDAYQGLINWTGGNIYAALFTSSYTPSLNGASPDHYFAGIHTNECSGSGYTAGGVVVPATPSLVITPAASWANTYATSTTYFPGDVVLSGTSNGVLYKAIILSGTSQVSSSAPGTWPSIIGQTALDGNTNLMWQAAGYSIAAYKSPAVVYSGISVTSMLYVVLYQNTGSGTVSSNTWPLICVQTLAVAQNPSGGTFTFTPDTLYGWFNSFPG